MGCGIEQPHPLEHLDPQEETGETTPDSQVLNANKDLVEEHSGVKDNEETNACHLRSDVDPIIIIFEVLFGLLFKLFVLD